MRHRIRVLVVEDNPADAELALRELKRANFPLEPRRVETFADYRRELDAFRPQVILCDYSMPQFNGMEALRIAKQSYPDIPFIFVSGTIGEESAVLALQSGARDYILKGQLLRLPSAGERALKETEERGVRHAHEKTLRGREKMYRTMFEATPHPIMIYDIGTLRFIVVNDAAVDCYGYSREEFLAMTVKDLLGEDNPDYLVGDLQTRQGGKQVACQFRTRGGGLLKVEMAIQDVVVEDRPARVMLC